MVNEKGEKKTNWVNAKTFMREHGYNELCLFLGDDSYANSSCVRISSENGKHSKAVLSKTDISNDFFPLLPLSNSVSINTANKDWLERLDSLKRYDFVAHNY
jgi:hypothetical protein